MWNSPVLPGFIDTHQHPLEAGNEAGGTCYLPPKKNLDSTRYNNILSNCWQNKPAGDRRIKFCMPKNFLQNLY